jgi:YYY domain-containing protein
MAVFPLWFRFARGLPSRGYALARAAGILLIGFVYWALNIFGALQNTPGSVLFVAAFLFVVGLISYFTWREREPILPWLRDNIRLIVMTELIFAVAFLSWSFFRALNPDQASTEKPMEIAFLSASRRSAQFPPNDPWMSGYAISYYHFGYILISMFANLSGVATGLAFGMASSFLFALTAVGSFGVAYDLVASRLGKPSLSAHLVGLLAVVLVLLMGNLGAATIEWPYQTRSLPDAYFQFMDIKGRDMSGQTDCPPTGVFPPTCGWWWFNLTRIVRDRQLNGSPEEIIDEFPMFSFVLSDIHPHVLSLPFVFLALGMMLNLVLGKRGAHPWEFLIYAICIGGLIFLNTWDAVFLGLLIGAEALRRLIRNGTGSLTSDDWLRLVGFAALTAVTVGLLYFPFFVSFRSQAGGFVPNLIYPTRFQQFLVMFGTFAFIVTSFALVEAFRAGARFNGALARNIILYLVIGAVALIVIAVIGAWAVPDIRYAVFKVVDESGGILGVLPAVLSRRLVALPTLLFLGLLVYLVIGRLFARAPRKEQTRHIITYQPATGFALLLVGAGAAFALLPEFAYIRDNFSTRINMIFKLYYQAWAVWGVASAYAVWSLLREAGEFQIPAAARRVFALVALILVCAGLIYTPAAIYSRMINDGGHGAGLGRLTLDGSYTIVGSDDDLQVIACLEKEVKGDQSSLVEAMGEVAYNPRYGRVSALSGIPTLLGWPNHERQWRGNTYDKTAGSRLDDISRLYNTTDWNEVQGIVKKYDIRYIFVGQTERQQYTEPGGLSKFEPLSPVCRTGGSAVYETSTMFNTAVVPSAGG